MILIKDMLLYDETTTLPTLLTNDKTISYNINADISNEDDENIDSFKEMKKMEENLKKSQHWKHKNKPTF